MQYGVGSVCPADQMLSRLERKKREVMIFQYINLWSYSKVKAKICFGVKKKRKTNIKRKVLLILQREWCDEILCKRWELGEFSELIFRPAHFFLRLFFLNAQNIWRAMFQPTDNLLMFATHFPANCISILLIALHLEMNWVHLCFDWRRLGISEELVSLLHNSKTLFQSYIWDILQPSTWKKTRDRFVIV